jgi:hypothetical protein
LANSSLDNSPKGGEHGEIINFDEWLDDYRIWIQSFSANQGYIQGYEQAVIDTICFINTYLERGERCMQKSNENNEQREFIFWDGFHNCAENILRELEEE